MLNVTYINHDGELSRTSMPEEKLFKFGMEYNILMVESHK